MRSFHGPRASPWVVRVDLLCAIPQHHTNEDSASSVALNRDVLKLYPFCRLTDTANVLVMPAFHAASISTKMLKELGGATIIGPILVGMSKSVQICTLGSKDSDIVNMAALAAYDDGDG